MQRQTLVWGLVIILVAAGLAACTTQDNGGAIHIVEGEQETRVAQTAWALANPTATPGPSPTPTMTSTPYVMPTNAPDVDGDLAITRVGNATITQDEFQKQVRFERWFRLYQLVKLVERHGVSQVLDLTRPENATVASLFVTLADSNSFGMQVHRVMVIDEITLQEAARRNMDVDPYQYDARLAQVMGLQVGEGGALPPEFAEQYPAFLAEMRTYTGMTEEDFTRIIRARTLYTQLEFLIGQEPGAVPSGDNVRIGMEVQDILVDTQAQANEVIRRLEAGEAMAEIAASLGLTPTSGESARVLRRSDASASADVLNAVFSVRPGDIVGPIATPQGWYVARVQGEVFDILSPQDIDAFRKQHFLNWVESRMDNPAYVEDYANWFDTIPQEPLPRDVSPLLHDENVIVPPDPFATPSAE